VPGELNYGTAAANYQAGVGYDLATGLGSVNADNLFTNWNTVTFNATTTTLGSGAITGTHGSPMTLNISVAPSSGTGTPTGDVSLQTGLNPGANPAFLTLSNGSVTSQVNDLPGGSYTLTARYAGDFTYAPSTSGGVQVSITPENSLTTGAVFTVTPNGMLVPFTSGQFGSFLYLYPRADVAGVSGNGIPSGTVQFFDNGSSLWSTPLNSQGNALLINGLAIGTGQHSLTASYQGDASFKPSTSVPVAFTITQASTALGLSASPTTGASGASITLTANVTSSAFAGQPTAGFPSGTVTFSSGGTQIGTASVFPNTLTSSGVSSIATLATSSLPNGSNSITAQYSGNTDFSGSSSSAITVNISADFVIAPASTSISVSQGSTGTNTLTITGQTGYSNTVNFSSTSCTGLPTLTTCSFNPASITGTGNTTVSLKTTAPTSAAVAHSFGITTAGLLFAGVLLMGVPSRRIRSYAVLPVTLCVLAFGSLACGGGSNNNNYNNFGSPGTPKGTYTVYVTATTSDHALSHSATFTLVVK